MSGFTLHVESGPDAGHTFAIPPTGGVIGRQDRLEITLTDPLISRRHARVDLRDGRVWLTDLASANGTRLNGQPLTAPQQLRPGDAIDLGYSRLLLTVATDTRRSGDSVVQSTHPSPSERR